MLERFCTTSHKQVSYIWYVASLRKRFIIKDFTPTFIDNNPSNNSEKHLLLVVRAFNKLNKVFVITGAHNERQYHPTCRIAATHNTLLNGCCNCIYKQTQLQNTGLQRQKITQSCVFQIQKNAIAIAEDSKSFSRIM